MNRMIQRSRWLLASAAGGLVLGAALTSTLMTSARHRAANEAPAAAATPQSFSPLVKRVLPAVVSVDVLTAAPTSSTLAGLGPREQVQRGLGSGFLISDDGYVVTNFHVAGQASRISVTLNDQRRVPARLVGADAATDLAVLKIDGRRLPYVSFRRAATPQVGDWVVAIGSPFGLGGTATAGIVSAYGRDIGQPWVRYIQVDAPINRGNSGGPTFDLDGRVIGVNTAIFSPSGGSVGIGFAIPADLAQSVVDQLIAHGRVVRGYLGAQIVDLSPAADGGSRAGAGAAVASVQAGGPAARGGLRAGDIVTGLNGQPIRSGAELMVAVARARPGELLRMSVVRGAARVVVSATAGERPAGAD